MSTFKDVVTLLNNIYHEVKNQIKVPGYGDVNDIEIKEIPGGGINLIFSYSYNETVKNKTERKSSKTIAYLKEADYEEDLEELNLTALNMKQLIEKLHKETVKQTIGMDLSSAVERINHYFN
ncbi:MAG: hypothetical protein ABGX20_18750 [Bacillus sp. (in: firmicutes)]